MQVVTSEEEEEENASEGEQEIVEEGQKSTVTQEDEESCKQVTLQMLSKWVEKLEKVSTMSYGWSKAHVLKL